MKSSILSLSIFVLMFGVFACGSDNNNADNNDSDSSSITVSSDNEDGESVNIDINSDNLSDALNQLSDAMQQGNNNEDVEVMNFRDIKKVFPNRLMGLEKTDDNGETTKAYGFEISQADATYEDDDQRAKVQIVDMAKMGIAKFSQAAWANIDIDKESDDGYERTMTIDGNKAYLKWEENRQRGELHILYKDRYMVNIDTRNIEIDDLEDVLDDLDLDELED